MNQIRVQIKQSLGRLLGIPEQDYPEWLRFVVGSKWPYYVGCLVEAERGLRPVWICQKDLADEEEERVQGCESA